MLNHSLAKEWLEFIQDALFCVGLMLHQNMSEMSSISTSMELGNGNDSWHSCLFPTSTTSGRKVLGPELCFCRALCCFSLVSSIPNSVLALLCSYELDHFVMANLCQPHYWVCCFFFFKSHFVAWPCQPTVFGFFFFLNPFSLSPSFLGASMVQRLGNKSGFPGSGSDFPRDLDKSFTLTASIMKQKEVTFTYLRGTVKLKCLKALSPISLASHVSLVFVVFLLPYWILSLVCFSPPTFLPQRPVPILYHKNGYLYYICYFLHIVEAYCLWLVICYCLGHPETLILESLVESFIMLQFFGGFLCQNFAKLWLCNVFLLC